MPRRVLIAEQADTLRSVAETVLRQNGYDVIAVAAAEKAREVLELSKPDLIIIGADLAAPDGSPYHERIREDSKSGSIPMLLFEPTDKAALALPDEVVIPRPFDPKDLLHRVSVFLGRQDAAPAAVEAQAETADAGDDFLDAALGLDHLQVTDSEVMDQTAVGKRPKAKQAKEKLIGLDTSIDGDDTDTSVSTVDSLVIDENSSKAKSVTPGRTAPAPDGTGKIEILTDQFGMTEAPPPDDDEDAVHDYDWFVDAMKSDDDPAASPAPADSGKIALSDASAAVDPITPGPSSAGAKQGAGVDKFIDEFKKEMEQLRDSEPDSSVPEVLVKAAARSGEAMAWEEKLEQIGPAQIDMFAKEFARELGRKVAEIIVAKIDPEKLLRLLKAEIVEKYRKDE